jgi:LmbE family N-acetylglucosaminyl deacetylase
MHDDDVGNSPADGELAWCGPATVILAVSPHPDDAILSYGGRLAQFAARGNRVIVYTVFTGAPSPPYSPAAARLHELWDLSGDPMRPRLDEDRLAVAAIGATAVHGPFLDAIYRRDGQGAWLLPPGTYADDGQVAEEPALVADIAVAVERLITDNDASLVITCSATGNHADHVRTRDATVAAASRTLTPVRLWEDLPYAIRNGGMPPLPAGIALAGARAEPVDAGAWRVKTNAIRHYASQHRMLAHRGAGIVEQLDGHAVRRGGDRRAELVWHVATGVTRSAGGDPTLAAAAPAP